MNKVLGIDIGSVTLSAAVVDRNGTICETLTFPHEGDLAAAFARIDSVIDLSEVEGYALTGRSSNNIDHDLFVDSRVACIRSARERYPEARAILLVGGEFFSLIRLDADGRYVSVRTNTSCAAGTGSFLDQQAGRLSMENSAELSAVATANIEPVPLVATRCAVFAKTDLIHAQQEGYALSGIAEGLCNGLARNLVDTLFKDQDLEGPVLFTGGVSRNEAVVRSLEDLVPQQIVVDDMGPLQGALGAALTLLDSWEEQASGASLDIPVPTTVATPPVLAADTAPACAACLFHHHDPDRSGFYPPLTLQLSDYPDFSSYLSYDQPIENRPGQPFVEVDLYKPWPELLDAYIGIDIGSTSTKAVITTLEGDVFGGFYTRTSGRPLEAVQTIFEAIDRTAERERTTLEIHGSATTGSGRKFIGNIIGADEILDEISAHARAATELDPRVDTILEIGGQDAKFTTLRNGRVTLSVMNNVCAAGTGSFLEEQGKRLGVPIRDFARLTDGVRAPLVSDRCTVFMDRDINHLLSEGHTVREVLAAALHAVRENYLNKVADEKSIGKVIFFQGATAKNRSLVAAFEQKLGRPILVSPYCHLTGALGAALTLRDEGIISDNFAGISLYRETIPVRREVCTLCANHCKLSVADVDGHTVAFGFLCGRDYETESFVNRNTSGFDLLKERQKLERRLLREISPIHAAEPGVSQTTGEAPVIGLPDGLYMHEDLRYWEIFFHEIGLPVKTSRNLKNPITLGKPLTGAEFCAPMSAMHGHAASLMDSCDYLFLPTYLERKQGKNGEARKFCYFSQFSSPLISQASDGSRILSPLAATRYSSFQLIGELHKALSVLPPTYRPSYLQISGALEKADTFRRERERELTAIYSVEQTDGKTVDVVFLGRPYSVLPREMNKGIPDIFASLGIRVFYQDMIPYTEEDTAAIAPLLREINWSYGARILETAEVAARTPGLYPVFLTSFKCGPDSFIVEYVKKILDRHDKPYLILELDEHDSNVGYETRIEAAVRAFRNHLESTAAAMPRVTSDDTTIPFGIGMYRPVKPDYTGINPRYARELPRDKTLVLPNFDDYAVPLLAATLRGHGYPTIVMEETTDTIRRSMRWNNGQCIPMNAIAEGYVTTIRKHHLDPAECMLWIPDADFACNIKLYPHHIQEILRNYGEGMEVSDVYLGMLSMTDFSPMVTASAYLSYMFAGLVRRIACRIRPYEHNRGETNTVASEALGLLAKAFEDSSVDKAQTIQRIMSRFNALEYDRAERRPKVALFGDIYVRDNPVMNQNIIEYIEENGGEVVTMPFHEFSRMTANTYFRRWRREKKYGRVLTLKPLLAALGMMEKWYYRHFEPVVKEPSPEFRDNPEMILSLYGVDLSHEGESQDNLLKTWYISKQHPDLSLFAQLSPGFCIAGLVTEAMARRIKEVTGVPVLSITYDGTGGFKNDAILPYLKYPQERTVPRISMKKTG